MNPALTNKNVLVTGDGKGIGLACARRYTPEELTAAAWHQALDAKFFSYIQIATLALHRMAARMRCPDLHS